MFGCEEPVEEEVAVKTIKGDCNEEDRIKFLQEAAIMGQFDHPNIVKVMGIMATSNEVSRPSDHLCIMCFYYSL